MLRICCFLREAERVAARNWATLSMLAAEDEKLLTWKGSADADPGLMGAASTNAMSLSCTIGGSSLEFAGGGSELI